MSANNPLAREGFLLLKNWRFCRVDISNKVWYNIGSATRNIN
jgi:hypothetical protein